MHVRRQTRFRWTGRADALCKEARQKLNFDFEMAHVIGPCILELLVVPQCGLVKPCSNACPPKPSKYALVLRLFPDANANASRIGEYCTIFGSLCTSGAFTINKSFDKIVNALVQLYVPTNLIMIGGYKNIEWIPFADYAKNSKDVEEAEMT